MRLERNKGFEVLKNSLSQSHEYVKAVVKTGDTVIDATAGNGNDTVFLSELVGSSGKVYSFDIQKQAIDNTREKLIKKGLLDNVVLINDGHQNMDKYIRGPVSTVMFNLGYLPGGDHSIGTRGETTREALEKAMQLLKVNGLISLIIYYGGDSGFEEKEYIVDYIKTIDYKRYSVMVTDFVNQINCPPILVCIEKLY